MAKLAPDDKEQSAHFVETIKLLEVDEGDNAFDRAMTLVVPQ